MPPDAEPIPDVAVKVRANYLVGGRSFTATLTLEQAPGSWLELACDPRHPEDVFLPDAHGRRTHLWLLAIALMLAIASIALRHR